MDLPAPNTTRPAERPAREAPRLGLLTTAPRVLVVEDDAEMRAWVEETLLEAGYVTIGVGDPLSALLIVLGNGVDVVVTDWRMPAMDGLMLLDAVQRCFPEVPVVFVTAFPDEALRRTALERGACCFLPKPFRGVELLEHVRAALSGRPRPDATRRRSCSVTEVRIPGSSQEPA